MYKKYISLTFDSRKIFEFFFAVGFGGVKKLTSILNGNS